MRASAPASTRTPSARPRPRSTRWPRRSSGTQNDTASTLRHAGTGRPLAWANPAVGLRNAIAPPMEIHHEDDGRVLGGVHAGRGLRGSAGAGARRHLRAGARPDARRGGQRRPDQAAVHRHHHAALPARHPSGSAARRGVHRTHGGHQDLRARLSQRRRRPDRRGGRGVHSAGVGAGERATGDEEFYVSTAFLDIKEVVEVAKAADELGYDGMGIPDHVINLETLADAVPLHQGRLAAVGGVHALARSVGDDRGDRVGDQPAAIRHHRVPARDARSVFGGESDWHCGMSGRRSAGTRRSASVGARKSSP